jgi:hypothetical protein
LAADQIDIEAMAMLAASSEDLQIAFGKDGEQRKKRPLNVVAESLNFFLNL